MSDVIVKTESAEGDDEENGRITPRRVADYDYEDAENTTLMDQNTTKHNKNSADAQPHQVYSEILEMQRSLNEDLSNTKTEQQQKCDLLSRAAIERLLASPTSTAGVVIKDEPQDADITDVEHPACGPGSQLCNVKYKTEVTSSTAPIITSVPTLPQEASATNSHQSQTIMTDVVVKTEDQDTSLEKETSSAANTTMMPKISLVPTHRLSVKSEFLETPTPSNHEHFRLPQDFFDDLLQPKSPSPPKIKVEPIPENFFDDLLVDPVKERIEDAETAELEEKFSDRLKQLRELEKQHRAKDKKKHKKSKKKSRKRSRSRSRSRDSPPLTPKHFENKRVREENANLPSTSNKVRLNNASGIVSAVSDDDGPGNSVACTTADIELDDEIENIDVVQPHLPEIGPHLTAKQKRDRIMIRAKSLIAYLKRVDNAEEKSMSTFLYTSTVRKLPASHSYRNQHIYENRSPLHTIHNVSYKFNSHMSKFNFEEWGLASLPPLSAKIAKLIGYDATAVHNKLKIMKIPAKIKNIKSEGQDEDDTEILQSRSSLFRNVTTQTDEVDEIAPRKSKGYDFGVQVQPASFEIACQTLETESPSIKQFDNNDDLPIMAIMRELNDNQLMALHDFAELLKEPASNAMDMYRLRQRMLDIYKCSQLPSALATAVVPPSGNRYTSNESSPTHIHQQQQELALRIQTVCSADGQHYSANDPRVNFSGHRGGRMASHSAIRNVSPVSQSDNCYDPRNPSFTQRTSATYIESQRTHNYQIPHQQQRNLPPANNGNKYFGRGGLRR